MSDGRLIQFLGVIALLNILHLVDHILRGDFHWPIDEQSVGFLVVAIGCLLLLMLSVFGATVFAGFLWMRRSPS